MDLPAKEKQNKFETAIILSYLSYLRPLPSGILQSEIQSHFKYLIFDRTQKTLPLIGCLTELSGGQTYDGEKLRLIWAAHLASFPPTPAVSARW